MPPRFNPYKNIQPQLERYDTMKSLKNIISSGVVAQTWQKRKHADYIEDQIKKIEKQMLEKQKRRAFKGALLSIGSMFIPGVSILGKSLLSGLIAGGTSLNTKEMIKKMKDRVEDLRSGTFTDKLVKDIETQYQGQIDKYDPAKAALESFVLSFVSGKAGEKLKGVKKPVGDASTTTTPTEMTPTTTLTEMTPEGDMVSLPPGTAPIDILGEKPYGGDMVSLPEGPSDYVPKPSPALKPSPASGTYEFKNPKDFKAAIKDFRAGTYVDDKKTFADIFVKPFFDPTAKSSDVWQQFVEPFKAGPGDRFSQAAKSWIPFMTNYLSGTQPAYGMNPISDNLQTILNLFKEE